MPSHCFLNISLCLFEGLASCDAAGQIRNVSSPIVLRLLENDRIALAHCLVSSPAAFKIGFSVPTGTTSPGCPGTVTTFGFEPCL
jgi:hypothetical protein